MTVLLREQVEAITMRAATCDDVWERFASHLHGLVEMQILAPALAQSIAQAPPGSALADECASAMDQVGAALAGAIEAGVVRADADIGDVTALLVANVAVISTLDADAARRLTTVVLDGLRR